jgi:type II secretory pathway predicted ATPase ExeA
MNLVLKPPNDASYQAGKDFSVMISYDDSDAAGRADELLQRLGKNLEHEEGRLFHQWWNIEVLAFLLMRELAALEAATTDMIILVVREDRDLPDMVVAWMKRMLELRKDRPGALVVMLDSALENPGASREILLQLRQAAELGHMDFFATRLETARNAAPLLESCRQ